MVWSITIATTALAVWLISILLQRIDRHYDVKDHEEAGQLRLLFSLLRLLEDSPAGLVGSELKLLFCEHIRQGFLVMQRHDEANAGFILCASAAAKQIHMLKQRDPEQFLPIFSDPERITAGHRAIPRWMRKVEQLQQLGEIDAADARRFQTQLQDRHFELEADSCLLRANYALRQNNPLNAARHIDSAKLSLQQISCPGTREYRLNHLAE